MASVKKFDADPWSKMSVEESAAVDELMKRVEGLTIPKMDLDPKLSVLRFLRARNGNVNKAEKMLRHTIEFRDKIADKILDEFELPEVLKKYMPKKLNWNLKGAKFDKIGRLIALESLGQIDPKGIVNSTAAAGPNFMGHYNSFSFELTLARMREITKQRGVPTCQVVLIEDLKGLGTQHLYPAGLSMFGKIVRVMEDHYPEVLGAAVVVNAPSIFSMIWNIVSKFFDERTRNKIHILSSDYMPTLLKLMDKDSIPKELGGDWEEAMPTGGKIPDTYYEPAALGFKKLSIGRRDHTNVTLEVKKGDRVDWEWYSTNGKDIGFDVKFGDGTEVVKWERSSEQLGSFDAPTNGTLDFHWDNRFSMLRGKECTHRIRVNKSKKESNEDEEKVEEED